MHKIRAILGAAMLCVAFLANAALVEIPTGEWANYNETDTFVSTAVLSEDTPLISMGLKIVPGQTFSFVITVPDYMHNLHGYMTSGPGFGYTLQGSYGFPYLLNAGGVYEFIADGVFMTQYPIRYMVLWVDDPIADLPAGGVAMGEMFAGDANPWYYYDPAGGDTGGGGGDTGDTGGSGGDTGGGAGNNVPEPGSLALFGLGLIGLGTFSLKKQKKS